jgi:P27 family predicted phage terminase small subunit
MINTEKYTSNTQLYIKNVEDFLKEKYGEIKPSWIGLLDSLAFQYNLYQLSKVGIEENGLVTQTNRGIAPNPCIKILNDANIQVQKLVNALGISPMAESKLKVEAADDTDDFLNKLTK